MNLPAGGPAHSVTVLQGRTHTGWATTPPAMLHLGALPTVARRSSFRSGQAVDLEATPARAKARFQKSSDRASPTAATPETECAIDVEILLYRDCRWLAMTRGLWRASLALDNAAVRAWTFGTYADPERAMVFRFSLKFSGRAKDISSGRMVGSDCRVDTIEGRRQHRRAASSGGIAAVPDEFCRFCNRWVCIINGKRPYSRFNFQIRIAVEQFALEVSAGRISLAL